MIEYKEFRSELINEVYSIYEENQWKSYLGDKEKLSRAFEQSLYLLGAFEEGNLVGFVRCIGDSEYILYVQDLIVKPSYYRQGIGKALMARVAEKYSSVRQFVLITDEDDEASNAFYRAIGLVKSGSRFPVNLYFRERRAD
ncbi:hypothetical protein BEQ56_06530 [Anaerolineaceae bacterium oral taxon 439]|nr:hypothetical protein BEQ56_06530 [Anaerolineaceae bacterium oral taxon 439]